MNLNLNFHLFCLKNFFFQDDAQLDFGIVKGTMAN